MTKIAELIRKLAKELDQVSDTARLDAEVFVQFVTGLTKTELITKSDYELSNDEHSRLKALVERRKQYEPVAYITGEREFYGRSFKVTPAVLIPRPESELLVEEALKVIDETGLTEVLDLGTGSGCIAITLAAERPSVRVTATDLSSEALEVAKENAKELGVANRIDFLQGSWFEAVTKNYRLIVSNPPYISRTEAVYPGARFEPDIALYSEESGLKDIEQILGGAKRHLRDGGVLIMEHGSLQAAEISKRAEASYRTTTVRDLAQLERLIVLKPV